MENMHAARRLLMLTVFAWGGVLSLPAASGAVEPAPKWSISLKQTVGYPADHILIGKRHLYFMISHPRGSKHPFVLSDDRPKLNDTGHTYDHDTTVTCVDGTTGKKLWSRRLAGGYKLAIDPAGDDLLCWRKSVYRLSAAKGDVVETKVIPEGKGWVHAIVVGGHVHQGRRDKVLDDSRVKAQLAFNVAAGTLDKVNLWRLSRLAPDEKKYLFIDLYQADGKAVTTITAKRLIDGGKVWSYQFPDWVENEPLWYEDDVICLNGSNDRPAELVRLHGDTGKVKWRLPLPQGAYVAGRDQLPGNAYMAPWDAVSPAGKYLLFIDGKRTLHLLDPATGKVRGRLAATTQYLACPRVIGDTLVIASLYEIRAIPLQALVARD